MSSGTGEVVMRVERVVVMAAVLMTACGPAPIEEDGGDPVDSGSSIDAGSDAGTDAGSDAGTDSGSDAGIDCASAADGADCGVGRICLGGECVEPTCGDGFVSDPDEACDDGNDVDGDGCTACQRDCTVSSDCDDGDPCNGVETCDGSTCVAGTAVDCDDADPCTADACAADGSCEHTLIDADGDGFAATSLGACGTDCDDTRDDVSPDAAELCDDVDHDCDGAVLPPTTPTWYADCDGDDYAAAGAASQVSCDAPGPSSCGGGWTSRAPAGAAIDCVDGSAAIHPGATELRGDGIDQDCNAGELCFGDADNDGYYTDTTVISADADCADAGEGAVTDMPGDCNDSNIAIRPNAGEIRGDGVDQNCDGGELCFGDRDNDGYYVDTTVVSADLDCNDPGEGTATETPGDCNDGSMAIRPNATEIPGDGVDQNCDTDELCFVDGDGDGHYLSTTVASADLDCDDVGEASLADTMGDCNDGSATINAGALELCNTVDEDCDGAPRNTCPASFVLYGTSTSSASTGGSGGTAASTACPGGTAVSGFTGRSASLLDQVRALCRPYVWRERVGTPEYQYRLEANATEVLASTAIGGTGGAEFTRRCTDGSVVTGISGRSGALIDQFALRCTEISAVRVGMTSTFAPTIGSSAELGNYGGTGGSPFALSCPPGSVVRSVLGTTSSGGVVESLRLTCAPLNVSPQ